MLGKTGEADGQGINIARRALWATAVAALLIVLALQARTAISRRLDALPITEIRGEHPGPTVALVAGVHGGKVAAVHALDQLAATLRPDELHGTVLLLRPANRAGFRAGLAQISPDDSLNLNRVFPGRADGSPTERLAHRIIREVVERSDFLVDMHGSDGDEAVARFAYAAHPGLDPRLDSTASKMAVWWGVPFVVWDTAGPRTIATSTYLQTAAHLSGVPAITVFEAGTTRVDSVATVAFITGALELLRSLDVLRDQFPAGGRAIMLEERVVMLAPRAGEWRPAVAAGHYARPGELLGHLADSSGTVDVLSAVTGVVLHQRQQRSVTADTPLIILGKFPAPVPPPTFLP